MKTLSILAVLLVCVLPSIYSQQRSINGKVSDTLERKPVANAVIALMQKRDSLLVDFTRSKNNGDFTITAPDSGAYLVLVTYPRFADFIQEVEVKQEDVTLPAIALTERAQLLEEVVIRGGQAIRVRGDTTEFMADSFAVREGATVEELLKKLPGITVDAKGNITTQGQRVEKVLVDGEEFFGDDPTMATQNIGAKAVHKVQVFDTKSDQQQLTGLNSGSEGKTINIELKANKRRGSFGKLYAGSDFNRYHDAKGLYNRFVGKQKFSVYASRSTVNTGSLDWNEREKLGIERDGEYDEVTGFWTQVGDNDFEAWGFRGLPDSYTAGALFIDKWKTDRHGVNLSYRYNRLQSELTGNTLTQNILTDSVTYSNSSQNSVSLNEQHAANGRYEWKLDSLATLKLAVAGTHRRTDNISETESAYLTDQNIPINSNEGKNNSLTSLKQIDNVLSYNQKFRKKGRQLLATLRVGVNDQEHNGFLFARTSFYENGVPMRDSTTDQQKIGSTSSLTYGVKFTYSEPLTKTLSLVGIYGYNASEGESGSNSFNRSSAGKYETRDTTFSNNFDLNVFAHSGTFLLKYTGKKLRATGGTGLSNLNLDMLDKDRAVPRNYNFLNHTPVLNISFSPKQQQHMGFRYNGSTVQPALSQLQPLRSNNDPLNVFVGNPDLKVGFAHRFSINYGSYKVLRGEHLFGWLSYTINKNAIVMANSIDEQGRRVYTPVNVNGNNNWWGDFSYGIGQGEKKLKHSISISNSGGNNVSFINGQRSDNRHMTTGLSYGLDYEISKKFEVRVRPRVGYNNSKSSLQTDIKNNYFTFGGNSFLYVALPWKMEISTELNVDRRQKISAFDRNVNLTILNGTLSKKVFRDDSGKFILQANDIFNQNRGYSRIIASNFVTDDYYSNIARYFLLKFEWSFNKMPGETK